MAEYYKIRIKRGDSEIEVESHDKKYVEEKVSKFLSLDGDKKTKQSPEKELSRKTGGKKISLQEFLRKVNPETGPKGALTICYFFEKNEGQEEVKTSNITGNFKKIRKPFKNPWDAISKAKDQGLLMDGNSPKHVLVTQTGEEWVENRLRANNEK